jgi:hypothetical protein
MTEEEQQRQKKRRRIWIAVAALVALLAVLIVPPFLSISSYKSRITSLMAESLGRPVRLSSVSLRLLPRPGFVLDDLVVEEDPAFGAEPLLHATTVTASIRLLSLWRGRLELSSISVDEASLNLVRSPEGNWNLDSLLRTAATKAGPAQNGGPQAPPLPYIAATNSRVNFKNGVEKLPFSLIDTDLSVWQQSPGAWRLRLRGQPVRTDVSLAQADTGIVELSASARRTPDLRQMPIQFDLDWRNAQLGQLTRLVTGSDAGWRGDLRGEIHAEGTAESANVKTRLRATDVHRAEFAPAAPMDFDANCSFVYHYSGRTLEKGVCDSPLGNGHIRLTGDLPGKSGEPHLSVELDKVPLAAGLDALRTVRSDVNPDLTAAGTASGKVVYNESPADAAHDAQAANAAPGQPPVSHIRGGGQARPGQSKDAKAPPAEGPLSGSFTLEGFKLSGGGLSKPIEAPTVVLQPAPFAQGRVAALAGTVAVPLGSTTPLTLNLRLEPKGYQVGMRGQVSVAQGRELARAVGIQQAAELNELAGDAMAVDLIAEGPWLPAPEAPSSSTQQSAVALTPAPAKAAPVKTVNGKSAAIKADPVWVAPAADSIHGTVSVHDANWKADYLVNHVQIADATLHVDLVGGVGDIVWDPVNFSYGPLKGTASFSLPAACETPEPCPIHFQMHFGALDSVTVQAAILGARQKGTLLSDLINRLRPAAPPVWPLVEGTVDADSLVLGPVTLKTARAGLRFKPTGAEITSLDANLLGGSLHADGTLASGDKPTYALQGKLEKLSPVAVGQMMGATWRGGTFDANGKIELSGYTGDDLAGSAKGTLHFEWRNGTIGGVPKQAVRFDRWTADAAIAGGKAVLGKNELTQGRSKQAIEASVTLVETPRVSVALAKPVSPKKP